MLLILLRGPDFGIGFALYSMALQFVMSPIVWILAPLLAYLAFEIGRACLRSRRPADDAEVSSLDDSDSRRQP